jgi:hypothetical protein
MAAKGFCNSPPTRRFMVKPQVAPAREGVPTESDEAVRRLDDAGLPSALSMRRI